MRQHPPEPAPWPWPWPEPTGPVRLGVSACLVGHLVRYDGQHKRDSFVADALARHVELVPVCPEVEVGMGVPRDTLRLIGRRGGAPRLVAARTGRDHTAAMVAWSERRLDAFEAEASPLSGYVLKKDSPSCGMARVRQYPSEEEGAVPTRDGVGLYAAALAGRFPHLPIEEEGRLCDRELRDNFVERVFAYHRAQALLRGRFTVGQLVAFHAAHKLALLAHSPEGYRALGKLVAAAKGVPRAELRARYLDGFMRALAKPATPGRHANVLQHAVGYFKKTLDEGDRRELLAAIDDVVAGRAPLLVPLALLRHHVRRQGVAYLAGQVYLYPPAHEQLLRGRA